MTLASFSLICFAGWSRSENATVLCSLSSSLAPVFSRPGLQLGATASPLSPRGPATIVRYNLKHKTGTRLSTCVIVLSQDWFNEKQGRELLPRDCKVCCWIRNNQSANVRSTTQCCCSCRSPITIHCKHQEEILRESHAISMPTNQTTIYSPLTPPTH